MCVPENQRSAEYHCDRSPYRILAAFDEAMCLVPQQTREPHFGLTLWVGGREGPTHVPNVERYELHGLEKRQSPSSRLRLQPKSYGVFWRIYPPRQVSAWLAPQSGNERKIVLQLSKWDRQPDC